MYDNVLQKIKKALEDLSGFLDQAAVRTAIGAIPDSIMNPVIEGLRTVLGVITDALTELKEQLGSVASLTDLLQTINELLDAVAGLAPGQRDTLETVKNIVGTLSDITGAAAEIDAIIALANGIVTKLQGL